MSQDFVQSGLFRAFSQEDPLTAGAGLGLSVVAKLVKGLGGKVEVNSTRNEGTIITVTIPVDATPCEVAATQAARVHESARLGLLQVVHLDKEYKSIGKARRLQLLGIENACRALGARWTSSSNANINLAFEGDLSHMVQGERLLGQPDGAHLIVLCKSLLSTLQLQKSHPILANVGHVEYVPQPFGPECINDPIANCLEASQTSKCPSAIRDATAHSVPMPLLQAKVPTEPSPPCEGVVHLESTLPESQSRQSSTKASVTSTSTEVECSSSSDRSPSLSSNCWLLKIPVLIHDRKLSLLLVDDNPINLRLLTAYADKNKHPRLTAVNGLEAVNAYKASVSMRDGAAKPEGVFLDINMPVLDGFQAARQIRTFERQAGIKPTTLIALTCLGSDQAKEEAQRCGIDMFLTKLVRPRDLTKILQSVQELKAEA